MISIEQWRARIGLFNCKQCSGFLSSFVSPPSSSFSRSRHRQRSVVQWLRTLSSVIVDSFGFLPAFKDHPLTTTSLPECSSSFSSSSSSSVSISTSEGMSESPSGEVFSLRRSLLRDLLIILLIAIISQQLIISGDIETNPGPTLDDKPGLHDLQYMSYTGKDGKIVSFRLMDRLKPLQHWKRLAIALKFPCHEISTIESKSDPVVCLLSEWLQGTNHDNDQRPVTWRTLIEALRHANFHAYANKLENHYIQAPVIELVNPVQLGFPDGLQEDTRDPITLFTSYVSHLKKLYTDMSHSHTFQHWTHLPRCEYIQLAMIGREDLQRGGPEEEMVRLAQKGKIETIMRSKENIKLSDLFMAPPKEPVGVLRFLAPSPLRVVLIEGAPGGGKSTLALHICHLWAQNVSFLAKFDIVILAYLRDEAIQNANTLADILPDSSGSSQILNSIKASKVLFIFDGWDEFPFCLQQESLVSKIIREPRKVNLQQSTVIVTTRPVASGNLQYIAHQQVEILGFTRHQVHEYIGKALKGNLTHIQKLVQHLEDHPVIEGYCYVPLHAAILVHVFLTLKKDLPTTHHELFCDLVLCCIVRELETHTPVKTVPDVSSLDDLPDDLKSQLSALCVLAYEGVVHDKVVFYKKNLQDCHLPANLPSLGLLQAVEGLTLTSKSISYNFLHLSVQELLAAYHISQMHPSQQVQVFKRLLESYRLLPVLHYYSGFTKLCNQEIQQFICDYSKRTAQLHDILPLLHCFFEAQQPSLSLLVDHRFRCIEVDSLIVNPVDYLVIGYFIKSLLLMSTATDNGVSLTMNNINEHNFELLLCELLKYEGVPKCTAGDSPCQLILGIRGMTITNKRMKILLSYLGQSPAIIFKFSICDCHLLIDDGNDLLRFADTLQTLPTLSYLALNNFMDIDMKLYNDGQAIPEMFRLIMNNKSLTHLDLSKNKKLLDSDAHRLIFQGLQLNTTLLHINLSSTGITATEIETFKALKQMLQDNQSLIHFDLSKNALSCIGAWHISQGLQRNTTLVHLDLSSTDLTATTDTVQALTQMLKDNRSLKHLFLSNNNFYSETERCSIFDILKHNTTLAQLNLSNTNLTAEDARVLETMLEKNNSLAHLDLSQNTGVSDLGTQHIVHALHRNTTLVHLNLCRTGITNEGAKYIAQALTSECSLQTLNISFNYIGDGLVVDDCFRHIERALESESCTLRKLIIASYVKYGILQSRADTINRTRQREGLSLIDIVC